MFPKKFTMLAFLAAAVGGPYLWFDGKKLLSQWTGAAQTTSADPAAPPLGTPRIQPGGFGAPSNGAFTTGTRQPGSEMMQSSGHPLAAIAAPAVLDGGPIRDFSEVIRFDISPQWVTQRWSRVTTTLSETSLAGMRVPLVTGTRPDDLAGSLTYYFDKEQRVQRVSFTGYTGDHRRLAALLTKYFEMKLEPSLGAGLYMTKWNNRPTSVLRVRHLGVMRADMPNTQQEITLEINRPGMNYGLSPEVAALIGQDQKAKLW